MGTIAYARINRGCNQAKLVEQVAALKREGASVVFTDVASGNDLDRPGLAKVMAAVSTGDLLLVENISRIARDSSHLCAVLEDLVQRGVGVKSLSDHVDLNSETGKLLFDLAKAVVAKQASLMHRTN